MQYPPEPWYLGGDLLVSAFRLRAARLPAAVLDAVPPGYSPLVLFGEVTLGAVFVHYRAGGVLQYQELLVACPVTFRGRLRLTILYIWVTSESSMEGGRELWGIPKCLGQFDRTDVRSRVRTAMAAEGQSVASIDAQVGRRLLPGSHTIPLPTAQALAGRTIVARNFVIATVRAMRGTWQFDPEGPLGYLTGRNPLFSVCLWDSAVIFGMNVERS